MADMMLKMTFGLGLMALAATEVSAQSGNCAPRAVVLEQLADRFGETRRSIGLGSQGQVVEVFASDASGSWTITVTLPSGITCLVASGQSFETLADGLPNTDDDA